MIDFHSHILPALDDGSRNMEETMQMLCRVREQRVQRMVATPHFYAQQDSITGFLLRREKSFRALKEKLEGEEGFPQILLGAEVYYFPGIGKAEMIPALCIEDTSVLLLELPFAQWTEKIFQDVRDLIKKQGLSVILAHVERYEKFQKNKTVWNSLLELPLCLQINAGSIQNRKRQKLLSSLFGEKRDVVLGSDCHNLEERPPNLAEGRFALEKKWGTDVIKQIDVLGERILGKDEW